MAHTTYAPAPQAPTPAAPRHDRSRRTVLGWLALAAAVVASGILILLVTSQAPTQPEPAPVPNGTLVGIPENPEIAERWLAHQAEVLDGRPGSYAGWPAGVPQSADAAERWFAQQAEARIGVNGWPKGVAHTPDALDRWLAQQAEAGIGVDGWPKGVAHTPDALDRWLAQQR